MNGDIRMSVQRLEAWGLKDTGHGDVSYGTRGHNMQDMKMCAQRKARRRLRLPSVSFPWSLAGHHQSLASTLPKTKRRNEEPEEEGGDVKYGTQDFNMHDMEM